jgi:hypothetical protein
LHCRKHKLAVAGCTLELDADGTLKVTRQPMLTQQIKRIRLRENSAVWWDGRFVVSLTISSPQFIGDYYVRPLLYSDLEKLSLSKEMSRRAHAGVGVLPVVVNGHDAIVSIPHLSYHKSPVHTSTEWIPRYALDNSMTHFIQ